MWTAFGLPFGGVHVENGVIDARFPGQWFQAESGLHQNWMRDYDPTTGRYIEADPLGLVDGASVYNYALQNPGRYVDPTGEFVPVVIGVVGGIILDIVIEKIAAECGCERGSPLGAYGAAGAGYGATGPFVSKPRTGVSGGGKSKGRTSWWSTKYGSSKSAAGKAARRAGRRASRAQHF